METEERQFRKGLGLVLSGALVFRALFLMMAHAHPIYWDLHLLDSQIYRDTAARIAAGDLIGGDEAYRLGPLYPYVLAALEWLYRGGKGAVYIFQQILGLGSIVLTGLIARRCFGARAGVAAASLVALYAPLAMLELKFMASTLAVFLGLAAVLALLVAREGGWRLGALFPGILLGLTCLARPETLLLCGAAWLWLLWDGGRLKAPGRRLPLSRLPAAVYLALGVILAIAPATYRNYLVEGELILISSQGGVTFYQGNNERANGSFTRIEGFTGNPQDQSRQSREIAEKEAGRALSRSQVSSFWFRKGAGFLLGDSTRTFILVGRKLLYWFRSDELSAEYVLPTERELLPLLWLLPVPFGLLISLAVAGMRQSGHGGPPRVLLYLFVLTNLLTVLTFYFSSRYRLPAVPYVSIFAGVGLLAILDRARDWRRRSELSTWLLPSAVILLLSILPLNTGYEIQAANEYYNLGNLYYDSGRYEEAVVSYHGALEELDRRWQVHYNLGNTYRRLERWDDAVAHYQRVLEKRPEHAGALRRRQEALEKSR